MCLCMYVAMSENRFLRLLPFRHFRVSHSMKFQNMTLLSKIKILISKSFVQIYMIFCHNVSVQDKG
jgi:hypothetical protein